MARDQLLAGIDVGTTKICAVLAEVSRSGHVAVVGNGISVSRGLRRGVVVSIEDAGHAIAEAVEHVEKQTGHRLGAAYVTISGAHIGCQNSRGVTTLPSLTHDISPTDVQRAIDSARAVPLPTNRDVIHVVPRTYSIDGEDGIQNPLGMSGQRLEVETHVVTGAQGTIHNLIKCVQHAGVELDDLVLQPLAAADAVISEHERELGVIVVDIGGGTTDIAIFVEGSVYHTAVLPEGGSNVTNSLAIGLRAPMPVAEEIKITYGHVDPDAVGDLPLVEVSTFDGESSHTVERQFVAEIIQWRTGEILRRVADEIERAGYGGLLGAGVVLTGGVAAQQGITELAERILDLPVRLGHPMQLDPGSERMAHPAFAATIGLVHWGLGQLRGVVPSGRPQHTPRLMNNLALRAGRFVRAFLP